MKNKTSFTIDRVRKEIETVSVLVKFTSLNAEFDEIKAKELDKEFKEKVDKDSLLDSINNLSFVTDLNDVFYGWYVCRYFGRYYVLSDGSNGHYNYVGDVEDVLTNKLYIGFDQNNNPKENI